MSEPEIAEIETRFGSIHLEFYTDVAPKTVENFKKLARSGFYDGTTFWSTTSMALISTLAGRITMEAIITPLEITT